jgi:hypothetical protein
VIDHYYYYHHLLLHLLYVDALPMDPSNVS